MGRIPTVSQEHFPKCPGKVPSPHQASYWIYRISGSVLVTSDKAFLFVDNRYTLQAKEETQGYKLYPIKILFNGLPTTKAKVGYVLWTPGPSLWLNEKI